jgi:hypothetical protein
MQRSGKISRNYHIPAEQYQEALQGTWIWFCQNIDRYDPTQANVMTWFNCTLKFRIKNVIHGEMVRAARQQKHRLNFADEREAMDLIDNLPAPPVDHSHQILTTIKNWLHQEQPQLEQKAIRQRPDLNAYRLIVRRLPTGEQASWQELSTEFGVSIPTLSSFYQRKCLPLLQELGRLQGWVDAPSRPGSDFHQFNSAQVINTRESATNVSHYPLDRLPKAA